MTWIVGLLLFLSGLFIGILIHYWGWNKSAEIKRLMRENNKLHKEQRELQTNVDDYFSKTNALIDQLNDSYQAMQNHLNDGVETLGRRASLQLNSLEAQEKIEQKSLDENSTETSENATSPPASSLPDNEEKSIDPPKDYAPKTADQEGTLSEDFGLKHSQKQENN